MSDEENLTPGPGEVGEGTPDTESTGSGSRTVNPLKRWRERRAQLREDAREELGAVSPDDEDVRWQILGRARNKLNEVFVDPAKAGAVNLAREGSLEVLSYLEENVIPHMDEATRVGLIALSQYVKPGRKSMIAAEALNKVVGKMVTDKAYDATDYLRGVLQQLEDEVSDDAGKEAVQELREEVEEKINKLAREEIDKAHEEALMEHQERIIAEHADKRSKLLSKMMSIGYSEKYEEQLRRKIRKEVLAGYGAPEDETEVVGVEISEEELERMIDARVDGRLIGDRMAHFILLWDQLETSLIGIDDEDDKRAAVNSFIEKINTAEARRKYDKDAYNAILKEITDKSFVDILDPKNIQGAENVINNLKNANFLPSKEEIEFLQKLAEPERFLEELARRAVALDSMQLAWESIYDEIDILAQRVLSNRAAKHDEVFRLNQYEENAYKGLQILIMSLGNRIGSFLDDHPPGSEFTVDIEGAPQPIAFSNQSTLMTFDIDREYREKVQAQTIDVAVGEWLANRVGSSKETVTAIHNISHGLTQGADLEQMKGYAGAKVSAEFVQRLLTDDVSLAEQELLKALSEEIDRNDGMIPDDFGLRDADGFDSIERTALDNLLQLIPRREDKGETKAQHRNRVMQNLRAGNVIAYAFTADAFHIIKHALPRQKIEPDEKYDGNAKIIVQAQQTHSKTYLNVGSKLIPFFYHYLYRSPPSMNWLSSMYEPRDGDASVVDGGVGKEGFGVESLLEVQRQLDNQRIYGASEFMRRHFRPNFITIRHMEDSHKMGATQSLKAGDVSHLEVREVKDLEEADHAYTELDVRRRPGSVHVYTYIEKNFKALVKIYHDRSEVGGVNARLGRREKTTEDLISEYNAAEDTLKRTQKLKNVREITDEYRIASVALKRAKEALLERFVELEVTTPLRDSMPSTMVSVDQREITTADYEEFMQERVRLQLASFIENTPEVQAFLAEHGNDPNAIKMIKREIPALALRIQGMLEANFVHRQRTKFDEAISADPSNPVLRAEKAREFLSPSAMVFTMDEYHIQRELITAAFRDEADTARTAAGYKLSDIFQDVDGGDGPIAGSGEMIFAEFMKEYGRAMQFAIGDYNDIAKAGIEEGLTPEQVKERLTVRYKFYSEDDAWKGPKGKDISGLLEELRKFGVYTRSDIEKMEDFITDQTDKLNSQISNIQAQLGSTGSGSERAVLRKKIRSLESEIRELSERKQLSDRILQWVDTSSGTAQNSAGYELESDSLARRAASELVLNEGSMRTKIFNKDKSISSTNVMSQGGNAGEKQLSHGKFEADVTAAANKLWLNAILNFAIKAKSGGAKELEDAAEDILVKGPLGELMALWKDKDEAAAGTELGRRCQMIQRFIQRKPNPEPWMSQDVIESPYFRNDASNPIQLAFPSSSERPVFSASWQDMRHILYELVSPKVGISLEPYQVRRAAVPKKEITIHGAKYLGEKISMPMHRTGDALERQAKRMAERIEDFGERMEASPHSKVALIGNISKYAGEKLRIAGVYLPTVTSKMEAGIVSIANRIPFMKERTVKTVVYETVDSSVNDLRRIMGLDFKNPKYKAELTPTIVASIIAAGIIFAFFIKKLSDSKKDTE